jgi:hypothetical protein
VYVNRISYVNCYLANDCKYKCQLREMAVLWDVALCSQILTTVSDELIVSVPDDGGSKLLRNVWKYLPNCADKLPRREPASYLLL